MRNTAEMYEFENLKLLSLYEVTQEVHEDQEEKQS